MNKMTIITPEIYLVFYRKINSTKISGEGTGVKFA